MWHNTLVSTKGNTMQSLVLYNAPQSTCSQRVRFTLHEKGLSFSEFKLDLFSGDQLRPEYLKINPNGVVPSLVARRVSCAPGVLEDLLLRVPPDGEVPGSENILIRHGRHAI